MHKKATTLFAILLTSLLSSSANAEPNPNPSRPNILLIMADDLGIEGLECYGGTAYRTPRLNELAATGLKFSHAYAQPLCTPTRVQLMTGKYNHRNWMYFGILDPKETTFGHRMQKAGYTTGIFGKWQLQSYDPPDLPGAEKRRSKGMHPKDAGFDRYALFHALHTEDKGSRYANPTMLEGKQGEPGQVKTYDGKYGEDIWVDKIVDFMDATRDEPTFVYYPMALPHWPFEPTPDSADWNPQNTPEESVQYFDDMVEYMDKTVGNLLDRLDQQGLRDNTLVLFYSDNGTDVKVNTSFEDGRSIQGGKATPKQTGVHVPLIAHWPGKIEPGVDANLVDASDFVPTLLELAGSQLQPNETIDGISFAKRLFGQPAERVRESVFCWYDPRPGWDKERFNRHVFALNKNYKMYRNGRLYKLTDRPLEEVELDPQALTPEMQRAKTQLQDVIESALAGSGEPPLVGAYGKPQHDFLYVPKNGKELGQINTRLLNEGEEFAYGTEAEQKLWIFKPLSVVGNEQRPCVFLVHGGSWGGTPQALAAQAVYLQRLGYTSVVIHFRPPTKGKSAAKQADVVTPHDTLRDARNAYRWVVAHGSKHNIDIDKIFVSGGSAGGHLSLALPTIALSDDPVIEKMPAGFVLFNPVVDLVDGWSGGRNRCKAFGIDPRSFSPAHHVKAGLPPVLVLSGSKDGLITPAQLESLGNRMHQLGNAYRFVNYDGAEHGFFNYGRHKNRYFHWTMWQFENFLSECLANIDGEQE